MHRLKLLFVMVLTMGLLAFAHTYANAQSHFSKWPAGSSPAEVGKRVAEKFLARKLEAEEGKRRYVILSGNLRLVRRPDRGAVNQGRRSQGQVDRQVCTADDARGCER